MFTIVLPAGTTNLPPSLPTVRITADYTHIVGKPIFVNDIQEAKEVLVDLGLQFPDIKDCTSLDPANYLPYFQFPVWDITFSLAASAG